MQAALVRASRVHAQDKVAAWKREKGQVNDRAALASARERLQRGAMRNQINPAVVTANVARFAGNFSLRESAKLSLNQRGLTASQLPRRGRPVE